MPSLKYAIINEICLELFKSINHIVTFPSELQTFMISSKEAFNCVLQAFSHTHYLQIDDAYVVANLIIDDERLCIRLPTDSWYCKPLAYAAASSINQLHVDSRSLQHVVPIIQCINNDMKSVQVEGNQPLNQLFEAFNSINCKVNSFYISYGLPDALHRVLKTNLQLFSVTCQVLNLSGVSLEMLNDFGNLNNPCLHGVSHLVIDSSDAEKSATFDEDLKRFAQFITLNFSGLKTLRAVFDIIDHERSLTWEWGDDKLSPCLKSISSTIKGSISFQITNTRNNRVKVPIAENIGIQYELGGIYSKAFPIHDGLNLKLVLRNFQ